MKIVSGLERSYEEAKAKATTQYCAAVYDVAENWANLMEKVIEPENLGESEMASVAKSTYHDADTEGITGLMYNFAAEILFKYWTYGKKLDQALNWATTHRVEWIDYKARLQQLERRVLHVQQDEGVEVPAQSQVVD